MAALGALVSLIPVFVLMAIGWLAGRAYDARRGDAIVGSAERDPALAVRRLVVYALLYVAIIVVATGIIDLADYLTDPDDDANATLARGLAAAVVGLPITGLLLRFADRRLGDDATERQSLTWALFLTLLLATSAIGAVVEWHDTLRDVFDRTDLDTSSLPAAIVWSALWAGTWLLLLGRHGTVGDLHLATGTIIGLVPLAIGSTGLLTVLLGELYERATGFDPIGPNAPTAGTWASLALIGAVVWTWYWIVLYRRGARTVLWHLVVVPFASLSGLVAVVGAAATIADRVGVWFVGEPGASLAERHFKDLSVSGALLIVGLVDWTYHRRTLGHGVRNDVIRIYDYLVAAAALVTALVGAVIAVAALLRHPQSDLANSLITGATLLAVGGPLWFVTWRRIEHHVGLDRNPELRTPVRRVYLFGLAGVGGIASLIAALTTLTTTLEDLLDGTLSRSTSNDVRFGIAVLLVVSATTWYHAALVRSEHEEYSLPPPPSASRRPEPSRHRLVVVVPADDAVPVALERAHHDVMVWRAAPGAHPCAVPVDRIDDELDHDGDALVVVSGDTATVVALMAGSVGPSGSQVGCDRVQ